MRHTWGGVRHCYAAWRAWGMGYALRQLVLVTCCVLLVSRLCAGPLLPRLMPPGDAVIVLALAAAGAGAVSAFCAALLGQLIDDERAVWIGVALGLYSTVVVPSAAIGVRDGAALTAIANARLAALIWVVTTLLVAAVAPRLRHRCGGRRALLLGLLWTGTAVLAGMLWPGLAAQAVGSVPLRLAICCAGLVAGLLLTATGWYTHDRAHSWIGMGCTVISLAHMDRVTQSVVVIPPGPAFAAVRLFGMTLVMVGLFALAVRVLRQLTQMTMQRDEELRLAQLDLRRAAERRHELRNGLAGLAGATGLLGTSVPHTEVLRSAVSSELARLHALLHPPGAPPGPPEPESYDVTAVLTEQVALRCSAGSDVRLDAEPGLRVVGSRATLAQVVTNLLANCAAHAPGSPVRLQAGRAGVEVFVRVTDFGPGIPEGGEDAVLQRGVRGARSSGQGLGLHLCDQLMKREAGSIQIRSHRGSARGCTVVLRLPAADPVPVDVAEPAGA